MSKTKFVKYGHHGFWAYDVALGVLIKFILEAVREHEDRDSKWLSEATHSWEVQAAISDFGFTLDENWSDREKTSFIRLVDQACSALEERKCIPAQELVSWCFADDLHIHPRGALEIQVAPVIELGRAVIDLVRGELPNAPQREAWIFGLPGGRGTIQMDASWDGRW